MPSAAKPQGKPPTTRQTSRRGRPRLTPDELQDRLDAYCSRYRVSLNDEGLPPFPSGRRESDQHREWMALYKAHRRLADRGTSGARPTELRELLAAQRGRCVVCSSPLELADARLDAHGEDRAATHARCLQFLDLARALGSDALEAARKRL